MESYHVCLDSGQFGIDGSVELLKAIVERKESGYNKAIFNVEPEKKA